MLVQPLGTPGDFDPVLDRARSARVVMLGEASHGTHDYYRLREQLTRRLIAEAGFSFVAVEGDWPDCARVDDSVRSAPGGPADPLAALERFERWPTWMWPNAEVVRFCRWLRAWNVEQPAPLRAGFHGLDVYSLWESMQAIFDYLRRGGPAGPGGGPGGVPLLRAVRRGPAGVRPGEPVRAGPLRGRGGAAADAYPGTGGASTARVRFSAWQNAEVVAGAERYYRAMMGGGPQSWNIRDTHMADTLDRLMAQLRAAGAKASSGRTTPTSATPAPPTWPRRDGQPRPARAGNVTATPTCCWSASAATRVRWSRRTTGGRRRRCCRCRRPGPARWSGSCTSRCPTGRCWSSTASTSRSGLTDSVDHRAIGVVYDPEYESWGNYVPTRLSQRYDAFVWCDQTERAASTAGPRDAGRAGDVPRRHLIAEVRVFAGQELCARLAVLSIGANLAAVGRR